MITISYSNLENKGILNTGGILTKPLTTEIERYINSDVNADMQYLK